MRLPDIEWTRFRRVALFLFGALLILVFKVGNRVGQWDFLVYLDAAGDVWEGANPYRVAVPEGYEHITILTAYVYPPFFARVLSPFSQLPEEAARFCWLTVQSLAFEALYWFGLVLCGRRVGLFSFALFHLIGIRYEAIDKDFLAGNTALVEAAVLTAWAALHRVRPATVGAALGVLLAIKPLGVFVVLWELVRMRWRSLLATVIVAGALGVGMLLDQPLFSQYREFLASSRFQEIMDEHTAGIFNHATVSVAFRLFTDRTMFWPVWDFPPLAYFLTFAVPILVWLLAFNLWRALEESRLDPRLANELGFFLLLPTVLLTTPRVADYTLVWLVVPFFFGTWRAMERKHWGALALFILAGAVENLPITGGRIDTGGVEMHLLQYRYASSVLFWCAAWALGRGAVRTPPPKMAEPVSPAVHPETQ
jgi:hypothetical protein